MKTLFAVFLSAFLICSPAFAGGWATGNGTARISYVDAEAGVIRVYYTATDTADPDSCGNAGMVTLSDDTKNGDRQYALLLAAFTTNKPVKLYVSGCWSGWSTTWPKLTAVFVMP